MTLLTAHIVCAALVAADVLSRVLRLQLFLRGVGHSVRFYDIMVINFFIIQAADSAEAYRIARDCPHLRHGGTIQLRRIEPT